MIHSSPITSLHPFINAFEDKFLALAEWVIEIDDDTKRHLKNEWEAEFKNRFHWIDNDSTQFSCYGDMDLTGKKLFVKCDFLKVNNHVLMLFQPFGRFSAYIEMESYVKKCLGSPESSITNGRNFSDNLIWKDLEQNSSSLESDTFPYGAKSAVFLESEYHLNKFVQEAKSVFKKKNISCMRLPYPEVKEYTSDENKQMPMFAVKSVALIKGFIVVFLRKGIYSDRMALQNQAKEWFPGHKQFVPEEELSNFLRLIEKPEFYPSAYQCLLKEIEIQTAIDVRRLLENNVPDVIVTSQNDQSSNKELKDFYLTPRVNVFMKCFNEMKDKIKADGGIRYKTEIRGFSISGFWFDGRIVAELIINESYEYIFLVGEDDDKRVGIQDYSGNLQNLVNMLDAVTQNWDIEKFQEEISAV